MSKISKFLKLDKNILLEYVYDSGNLLSEPYDIMVNSRDGKQSYLATDSTITNNSVTNSLFNIDDYKYKKYIYTYCKIR